MTTSESEQQPETVRSRSERALRLNPDIVTTRLDDNELVIYHLGNDRFYTLNGTGARIWELLSQGHAPLQIRQQLLQEFDVDETRLAQEITELLASFAGEQLLLANDPR